MKASPEFLILLLIVSVSFLLLLFAVVLVPRLLKRAARAEEPLEMQTVMGAFTALGGELQSLREQLVVKERLAALGEISAGIAHELRNPLAVIAGYAKLLLKQCADDEGRRAAAAGILKEVEEMNRIMEELLRFSKAEPITKREIDLSLLLEEVVAECRDAAKELTCAGGAGTTVQADRTLLKQALKNLVRNACDAGSRVGVAVETHRVEGKDGVRISVTDNGPGISPEQREKIFLPFFTTKSGGSGIGLALVHKIVTAHGGGVSVESCPGGGSTFYVILPRQ